MHPFAASYAWTQRPGQQPARQHDAPPPPRRHRTRALIRAVATVLRAVLTAAAHLVRLASPRLARAGQPLPWPSMVSSRWGSAQRGGPSSSSRP